MVGERGKWSAGREQCIAEQSRSATPAAEPQTEARRSCGNTANATRDERVILRSGPGVIEREKGQTGSPWNEAKRALVTETPVQSDLSHELSCRPHVNGFGAGNSAGGRHSSVAKSN